MISERISYEEMCERIWTLPFMARRHIKPAHVHPSLIIYVIQEIISCLINIG
jgi:hypothetical protein